MLSIGAIGSNRAALEPTARSSLARMVDSRLPRFAQALQAGALALAFLVDARWVPPLLALLLALAYGGGPRWNLFAYLYQALPIGRGELEPAAPHRFSQAIGGVFLSISGAALFLLRAETLPWWVLGWGFALAVALLAAIAAASAF